MGHTFSRVTEDPANGPGINLQYLKEIFLPPPKESQRARSSASTRMNKPDRPHVNDNARSSPPSGPGSHLPSPRQIQEKMLTSPTPSVLGVKPNDLTEPASLLLRRRRLRR